MDGLVIKPVGSPDQKSAQQIEAELIAKKEAEDAAAIAAAEALKRENQKPEEVEIDDEFVLSYIKQKTNKEFKSLDDIFVSKPEELPDDVAAFNKYKKETGRGIEDFVKLNRNIDDTDEDQLLTEYLLATEEGVDASDVSLMLEEFKYDEDLDDDSKINRKKLEKKKTLAKAKKYFSDLKENYLKPLESRKAEIPVEELEDFNAYKERKKTEQDVERTADEKRKIFAQKTEELFDQNFKGFEFAIGEKKFTFAPAEASALKESNATPMNLISKYLDEKGVIKDAVGYHRALSVAMNPEQFAKYFYEQGVASATESTMRSIKNIEMQQRSAPDFGQKGGVQIKVIDGNSGSGLKIRKL